MELGSQYQISHAEQARLAAETANNALSEQAIGELSRLVEQDNLTDVSMHDTVEAQMSIEKRQSLIRELRDKNIKFSEKDILFIARDQTGQIVWLETGNLKAGMKHIEIRHAADFEAKHNIAPSQLEEYLEQIFTLGSIQYSRVMQRNGSDGYERLYKFNGDYYMLSGVGMNGFIVSAYPVDSDVAVKLIERYKNERNS